MCGACLQGVTPLDPAAQCALCGGSFDKLAQRQGVELCELCQSGGAVFDWARGYGAYEGVLRHLIHLLKYGRLEPLARPLGARLATLLPAAGPVDLVVPVPLHRRRLRSRGFNHAELLAGELSRIAGLRLDRRVLRRVRHTETQTGLTIGERRLNVEGAFQVRRPEAVAGKAIALVDDVITTGATAAACAAVLKQAGASRVVVLALARARRRSPDLGSSPAPRPALVREAQCGA